MVRLKNNRCIIIAIVISIVGCNSNKELNSLKKAFQIDPKMWASDSTGCLGYRKGKFFLNKGNTKLFVGHEISIIQKEFFGVENERISEVQNQYRYDYFLDCKYALNRIGIGKIDYNTRNGDAFRLILHVNEYSIITSVETIMP